MPHRRLPYTAFANEDTLLHQAMKALQEVHNDLDNSIKFKIPEAPPKPSSNGLRRIKLDVLMRNIDACISSGSINSARNLYHYFIDEFRSETKPNLDLPPISIHQPNLALTQQDLLVSIINSAEIAEEYHDKGLNKGWDNLADSVKREIDEVAERSYVNAELVKMGYIRLNQLANLITDTGGWQDGRSTQRAWTQQEVDEAVSIVVKRDDHVSLLMRFEYFLKRCFPIIKMPYWKRPPKVARMTENEILDELYADHRNDFNIVLGIRGIVSIANQKHFTVEEFIEQCNRDLRPYGLKLHDIINLHVDHNSPNEIKLQQARVAVTTTYQNAIQVKDSNQIELMWELVRLIQRPDLTWEDIERKTVPKE